MINKIYEYIIRFIKEYYKEVLFIILVAFISFYKLPYVIYKPGGSIDLTSRVNIEDGDEVSGSYSMNYVSVSRGNIANVLLSYLIKDWELVKEENANVPDMDYDTSFKIEQLEYQNAIFLAVYNACNKIDCNLTIDSQESYVVYINDKADTNLEVMDKIISIDDQTFKTFYDLREYIKSKKAGDKLKIIVKNDGKEIEKYAIIYEDNGESLIGISAYSTYEYTTTPEISIKTKNREAGPSGGLMLTLTIYDILSEKDIANNRKIMGTGTIDGGGNVGAIGGVKYKMLGAKKDKADVFFVPMENCEEAKKVKKDYKIKYDVKCVATFDEALDYLLAKK